MNKFLTGLMAISVALAPMAAQANEWKNVPHPSYWPIGTTVTADMIDEQQGELLGHCEVVSYQTLPEKDKYILRNAIATGFNLAVGSVGELKIEQLILMAPLKFLSFAATAGGTFFLGAVLGVKSANDTANARFRSSVDNCMARAAGGIYTMGPVEEQEIRNTGPKVVGLSKNWHIMHPDKSDAKKGAAPAADVLPGATNTNGSPG